MPRTTFVTRLSRFHSDPAAPQGSTEEEQTQRWRRRDELQATVQAALTGLPAGLRLILDMTFGLSDGKEHSYAEIGHELGISRQAVHQKKKQALNKLRQSLAPPISS
jgi:RNA polymerase sigma factor (sigma-70 family)